MKISNTIYNTLFRRTSTFALTMVIGAYLYETGVNAAADSIFNSINQGKLWDHIKDNYISKEEEAPSKGVC